MPKRIDLKGQRFGALTALRFVSAEESPQRRPGWITRCDCGREVFVTAYNLRAGNRTSCGCGAGRADDLTGQRFGRLTALRFVPGSNKADHCARWLVRCECGVEKVVSAAALKNGWTESCGCALTEKNREQISRDGGNVFGLYDGTSVCKLKKAMASPEAHGIRAAHMQGGMPCWSVSMKLRGEYIYLGRFADYQEAVEARRAAERRYYLPIIQAYEEEKKRKEGQRNGD